MERTLVLAFCILLAAATGTWAYTGTLTAPDGLTGTGFWVADNGEPAWFPASITWNVTENPNGSWRYEYELSVYRAAVSHMIVETSVGFGQEDIFDAAGPFGATQIGFFAEGGGNPYIPGQIYGVKFDDVYGTTVNFSFNSWRMPVWGDFYAKCGAVGGTQNTVWNYGMIGGTGYQGGARIRRRLSASVLPLLLLLLGVSGGVAGALAYAHFAGSGAMPPPEIDCSQLAPAPEKHGFLQVLAQPWAHVEIDGEQRDATPHQPLPLAPGRHRVRLTNPYGFETVEREVTISPGKVLTITVVLQRTGTRSSP